MTFCPCCKQPWDAAPDAVVSGNVLFIHGKPVDLLPAELDLFVCLRADIGKAVPTDKLMTLLPRSKESKVLMVHLSKLRPKVSHAFTITNVKGKGYRLDAARS